MSLQCICKKVKQVERHTPYSLFFCKSFLWHLLLTVLDVVASLKVQLGGASVLQSFALD